MARAYSFSALDKYSQCGEFYRRYYMTDDPKPDTSTVATAAGTIVHTAVEHFYGDGAGRREIPVMDCLQSAWEVELSAMKMDGMYDFLTRVEGDYERLMHRASKEYVGADSIRTGTGAVPKRPTDTTAWGTAAKALGLDKRIAQVDQLAAKRNARTWGSVSLAATFIESRRILSGYRDPMRDFSVLEIEYPISQWDSHTRTRVNQVQFPNGALFGGKIDMTVLDKHGRFGIFDQKTSKGDPPSAYKVANWEQLLLYGWGMYELEGHFPDFIGINHVRTSTLVIADFDPELALNAVARAEMKLKGIDAEVFVMHAPTDFDSPCYKEFGAEARPCVFLEKCHPQFAAAVKKGK